MSLFDLFSKPQGSGTLLTFDDGSWGPNSSRSLQPYISNAGISNGSLGTSTGTTLNLTYSYSPPQDFTFLEELSFSGCYRVSSAVGQTTVTVTANNGELSLGTVNLLLPISGQGTAPINLVLTPFLAGLHSISSLNFAFYSPSTSVSSVFIGPFSSTFLCVARGSLIQTAQGCQAVENLQRGQEIMGGRVARIIREELFPQRKVELVIFAASSLEPGLPSQKTIVCANHYLVYRGRRRIAKSFLAFPGVSYYKGPAETILPADEEGRYYMYDIQFDCEAFYLVNGLLSQSRSPYAQTSPLPKELYFEPENYRQERVANTLREDPPLVWTYLLPHGEEVDSFIKVEEKDKIISHKENWSIER